MTFAAFTLVSLTVISGTLIPTFTAFAEDFPRLVGKLQQLPFLPGDSPLLTQEFSDLWNEIVTYGVTAVRSSLSIIVGVFNKFIDVVVILFVTFYLLKDGEEIAAWLAKLFPSDDYDRVRQLFDRILASLSVYVRSQLIICTITGSVVFIYFTLRDLPYASVFAVVSGIAEFIPVLGPTVASAFGTMLTLHRPANIGLLPRLDANKPQHSLPDPHRQKFASAPRRRHFGHRLRRRSAWRGGNVPGCPHHRRRQNRR